MIAEIDHNCLAENLKEGTTQLNFDCNVDDLQMAANSSKRVDQEWSTM